MQRFICIHGHFYQPPRENPWIETVELQDSAYPSHDWNERVTSECYGPNAAARIYSDTGLIRRIVNNYSRMSFNVGPTLLSWLEEKSPEVYDAILRADKESLARHGGHGSAMAQCYNHLIMPLATRSEKETQIVWGLHDFERRFGRAAEGMWLPEAGVDTESLEIMAYHGVRFTVLAPHQAASYRRVGEDHWQDVTGSRIDPTRPYRCVLPSGRFIDLFFYDGPISRAVAFENLLHKGEVFADRLIGAFWSGRDWPQLVHIATDGETYGHHHRYGEMALAYAIEYIEKHDLASITSYGQFLHLFPPDCEARILENTSWSCSHGVERWRANCGCNNGTNGSWNQEWRKPLRQAMDWLRARIDEPSGELASSLGFDLADARNEYIRVILERSPERWNAFFNEILDDPPAEPVTLTIAALMELQRNAQLMYTSCGWFFDDLAGIENIQILKYAARVIQLAGQLFNLDLESGFLDILQHAKSNKPGAGTGRDIYLREVLPAKIDLLWIASHFAVSSLFEEYPGDLDLFCYRVTVRHRETASRDGVDGVGTRMGIGWVTVFSKVTLERQDICYAVLNSGGHHFRGGVSPCATEEYYRGHLNQMLGMFHRGEVKDCGLAIEQCFVSSTTSLRTLFRDEQRKVLEKLLAATMHAGEDVFRGYFRKQEPLMELLFELNLPLPRPYMTIASFFFSRDIIALLQHEPEAPHTILEIQRNADDASSLGVPLDDNTISYFLSQTVLSLGRKLEKDPSQLFTLRRLTDFVRLEKDLPFTVDFWELQNLVFTLYERVYPFYVERERSNDLAARPWVESFRTLCELLFLHIE